VSLILDKFKIGDTISFQCYSTLAGGPFNRVKVTDQVSADTTKYFNFDAAAVHGQVIADENVPRGQIPLDYASYQYLVVTPAGDPTTKLVVGIPWIRADSITVESTRNAVGYFPNLSDAKLSELRLAITSVDISDFTINFE
jgi:hypothetical protein